MTPRTMLAGEIVQIDPAWTLPDGKPWFGGCLATVVESKSVGALVYVQSAGIEGQQYIRVPFDKMEPTGGAAVWAVKDVHDTVVEERGDT